VFLDEPISSHESMAVDERATRADLVEAYRLACVRSDAIVRAADGLDTLAAVPNPGEDGLDPLRSIVVHLIEETARHAGHADILRELIDGAVEL
jgi:hypothetical protein